MKKILALLITIAVSLSLASCSLLPEELQDTINGLIGGHEHKYTISECTATCTEDGENVFTCSCGDSYTEPVAATGHDMQVNADASIAATCVKKGITYLKCSNCGKTESSNVPALGHSFGTPAEPSRFAFCTREGCTNATPAFGNDGVYTETLTFAFNADNEAEIADKIQEIASILNNADKYDPQLHAYAEEGDLAAAYAAVDALHTELYDLVLYAVAQRQIAEIDYYCDMDNADLEERYSYMMDYYTVLIGDFYSLSQPFYDSCYREFYYYGMSEEEINAFLFDSNTLSNPEYTALKNRNNEIELAFLALSDRTTQEVNNLYAEFVENNNKMAKLMGYDNYLEYAYENVYSREYSYTDVSEIVQYVKDYIVPVYTATFAKWKSLEATQNAVNEYYSQVSYSFFQNVKSNTAFNNFIDIMAFTSNPDKAYSFSDVLNDLVSDGNLFRGDYEGAFVTSLSAFNLPVAYFGPGYDNPFTIAHEFGHYMNEIYNESEFEQSYDLLEMHSQGHEMLYLYYVKSQISAAGYEFVETYQILVALDTVMAALAVDTFEQAVYLNSYDGLGAEEIMADGKITADEYDALYSYILEDFGTSEYQSAEYWRHMTITSPCYYVSYAVSSLSVLQIYEMANTQSFDAAKESYLKLISYTDENPDMTIEEIMEYAGLHYFADEELYIALSQFFGE